MALGQLGPPAWGRVRDPTKIDRKKQKAGTLILNSPLENLVRIGPREAIETGVYTLLGCPTNVVGRL